jgi:CRP-like cAMP-binding protein
MFRQDLKDFPVFQGFSEDQIEWLAEQFELLNFRRNKLIFDQGQAAEHLYILASGKVIIRYKPYDGPPLIVATISPGGVFGWSAALGRHAYTSGALAGEESEVYRISWTRLNTLCEKCPDTGAILLKRLAQVVNERQQGIDTEKEILGILKTSIDKNGDCSQRMDPDGR